jgi:hypothetical protein
MTIPIKECHKDGSYLFTIGQARIHAGSRRTQYDNFQLCINLLGTSEQDFIFSQNKEVGSRFKRTQKILHIEQKPEIIFNWPDGSAPVLTKKEWLVFIEELSAIKGNVLIHCWGGHGRTGTLLAILGFLSGAMKGDCIKYLRERYCEKAVETEAQFKYLEKTIGLTTNEKPSKPFLVHPVVIGVTCDNVYETEQIVMSIPTNRAVTCLTCNRTLDEAVFYEVRKDGGPRMGTCWTCRAKSLEGSDKYYDRLY